MSARIVQVSIPVRLVSTANAREHWATRARRAKTHRLAARLALRAARPTPLPPPVRVVIERVGRRRLDSDNLAGSAKSARDGVADWLGIDDGDERIRWDYEQTTGPQWACRITVMAWGDGHEAALAAGVEA